MLVLAKVLYRCSIACFVIGIVALVVGAIALTSGSKEVTQVAFGGGVAMLIIASIMVRAVSYVSGLVANNAAKSVYRLTQAIDAIRLEPTEEDQHPWLDIDKLREWTSDLHSLGFRTLADGALSAGMCPLKELGLSEKFVRALTDEKIKCFAEIHQVCDKERGPGDVVCSIYTIFTSGALLWTHNGNESAFGEDQDPDSDAVLERCPGANPGDLLHHHVQKRNELMAVRSAVIREDFSVEAYQERVEENMRMAKDYIRSQIQELANV